MDHLIGWSIGKNILSLIYTGRNCLKVHPEKELTRFIFKLFKSVLKALNCYPGCDVTLKKCQILTSIFY